MANQYISGNLEVAGVVKLANNKWNQIGDDVQIGDQNISGHLCIQGLNGATGIRLKEYNGSSYADINYDGSKIILDKSVQISGTNSLTVNTVTINGALYIS